MSPTSWASSFEKLERALAFDSDVVGSVIQHIDTLKQLFATWMQDLAPQYLPFARGWDDKAKKRAVLHFEDKKRRDEFFTFFRRLENLCEVLSPDASLRPYLDDYHALAELYIFVREAYSDRPYVDKELTAKTKHLAHQHATSSNLELPGAIRELGVKELALLWQSDLDATIKVLNLRRILTATVDQNVRSHPYLLSIGERAEALAQQYEDRHLTTQQVLAAFEDLAQRYLDVEGEREQLGLDMNTFAIYTALKLLGETVTTQQAAEVNAVFVRHPDYRWDEQQEKQVRAALYRILHPLMGADKMIEITNRLLKVDRV